MNWLQKVATMTIEDIPAFLQTEGGIAYLKYVRVNGEYRFGDATSFGIDHESLANGEAAEGAAFVKIYPDGLYVEGYSSKLEVGPAPDDEATLSGLLGIPIKDRWQ